ncbi:hypothetical protein [Nocardiopsis sp. YSL2]|uniref:hypothetical protein n=1 Tax=Nocardiopsis sp. YSL2 TaxID=2939492 RepID=UPI0026F44AA9|nr:hypothetical protein [Nocardiopsis sp. YSL2]
MAERIHVRPRPRRIEPDTAPAPVPAEVDDHARTVLDETDAVLDLIEEAVS